MGTTAPASPTRQNPAQREAPAAAPPRPAREARPTDIAPRPAIPASEPTHDLDLIWERVLSQAGESNAWAGLIGKFRLRSIAKGVAHIEVLDQSLRSHAENARNKRELGEFVSNAAGQSLQLSITIAADDREAGPTPASHGAGVDPKLRAKAEQDPLVRRAMELFNARITDVRPGRGDDASA